MPAIFIYWRQVAENRFIIALAIIKLGQSYRRANPTGSGSHRSFHLVNWTAVDMQL